MLENEFRFNNLAIKTKVKVLQTPIHETMICPLIVPPKTELILEKTVNAFDFLFLTKLQTITENLGTTTAVLAGCVIALLDGALVLETTIALQEELHALAPAEPANGIRITSHCASLS